MEEENGDRRKYRFRVWDKVEGEIYPVISIVRGGIVAQAGDAVKTILRDNGVLMQYSGLLDSRGREIYENDIISLSAAGDDNQHCKVMFYGGGFRLGRLHGDIGDLEGEILSQGLIDQRQIEVVGNIYTPALKD